MNIVVHDDKDGVLLGQGENCGRKLCCMGQLTLEWCLELYVGVRVGVGEGEVEALLGRGKLGASLQMERASWGDGVCLSRRSACEWMEWRDVLPRLWKGEGKVSLAKQ